MCFYKTKAEPEDYNVGMSLYGDKAKTKTYAARFKSYDGYEVVSVLTRATNSLKVTFLEVCQVFSFPNKLLK
ncbi:hypothetical protein C5167_048909 [Papaver somniferum]|uniref:Uncharacterized protein n=1 Tax=Papaver somniferum TaxID=3469 RepID=A0A4Y7KMN4_PAPSO|nr:hypothetical protein C5167_048909 [Papaver somniferum]